ncbi:uncharacterized protein METZ01_LOCUS219923 [marine metagenome]|uniref:Uncharacterized protein n=1 Tax=marine metagenome TaxID=408172 RepID=A0A382FWR4_9ZZZZ
MSVSNTAKTSLLLALTDNPFGVISSGINSDANVQFIIRSVPSFFSKQTLTTPS